MVPSNINLAWTSWTRHSNLETKLQHVKFLSWIVAIQSADLLEKLQLFLCCMPNSKFAACKTAKAQMQECVFKCLPCPNEIIPYNHFAHLVATSFRIMFAWCIPRRKKLVADLPKPAAQQSLLAWELQQMSCHHMKSGKIMAWKLRCEHSNFRGKHALNDPNISNWFSHSFAHLQLGYSVVSNSRFSAKPGTLLKFAMAPLCAALINLL